MRWHALAARLVVVERVESMQSDKSKQQNALYGQVVSSTIVQKSCSDLLLMYLKRIVEVTSRQKGVNFLRPTLLVQTHIREGELTLLR